MVQASQPDTDSSTPGTMILGVQCACRVIQWKDGDHSIEPCQLHAVADDLLTALKWAVRELENAANAREDKLPEWMNWLDLDELERSRTAITEAQS